MAATFACIRATALDHTDRLPRMAEAFGKLPTLSAILDGELCLIDPRGAAHFYRLMAGRKMFEPQLSTLSFANNWLSPQAGAEVGVPGRGVGAEGGALHGGRPEGRPEGNALEAFSPGCPQRHRRGRAVMVRIEVGSGCET
jgi:hypothetical protein